MKLLGDVNWYLPRWLQWLPQLRVEGHETERMVEVLRLPEREREEEEELVAGDD
jgi:RND superfamily putative drug exporter